MTGRRTEYEVLDEARAMAIRDGKIATREDWGNLSEEERRDYRVAAAGLIEQQGRNAISR